MYLLVLSRPVYLLALSRPVHLLVLSRPVQLLVWSRPVYLLVWLGSSSVSNTQSGATLNPCILEKKKEKSGVVRNELEDLLEIFTGYFIGGIIMILNSTF